MSIRVLTVPQGRRVKTTGTDWERYSTYASAESIAAELADARKGLRAAERDVVRLEALHNRRVQEKADGTWPGCVAASGEPADAVRADRERAKAWDAI